MTVARTDLRCAHDDAQGVGLQDIMANPGAVCGNPRDAASWWLIVDTDARVLRWHRTEFGSEDAAAAVGQPARTNRVRP